MGPGVGGVGYADESKGMGNGRSHGDEVGRGHGPGGGRGGGGGVGGGGYGAGPGAAMRGGVDEESWDGDDSGSGKDWS